MKKIPLTHGLFALVDDGDYDELMKHKWHVRKGKNAYYARRTVSVDGKRNTVFMHRQILGIVDPKLFCDHIDMDGLNNQRANLRACNMSQNKMNTRKRSDNSTGYKGVAIEKRCGRFRVQICVNGKIKTVGRFVEIECAARAYDKAAKELHGEFARLNFPNP